MNQMNLIKQILKDFIKCFKHNQKMFQIKNKKKKNQKQKNKK